LHLKRIDPGHAYMPKEIKVLKETTERAGNAPPIIRKIHKWGTKPDPLRGLFEIRKGTVGWAKADRPCPSIVTHDGHATLCPSYDLPDGTVVEYEPGTDLCNTEQIPLLEEGGIEAFLRREVLPHAPDARYVPDSIKTGYEISFTRYFYKPQPLRTLEEISADILALERETEGLLAGIVGGRKP